MTQRMLCLTLTAIATVHFAAVGYGQGGGLLNPAAANRAAAQAQTQQRVQQRANAQVQQRVQAQVQQKVRSTLGNRVRGAAATAAGTAQRMQRQQTQDRRIEATAGVNARTNANAAGTALTAGTKIRINGSGRLVLPGPALLGNGEVNVKYFDNVFGRFNPFRQTQQGTGAPPASESQIASGTVLSGSAGGANGASEPANEDPQESRRQDTGNGIANQGMLHTQVDLAQAVRLRRSEISAMRDHALATGNAQLMASADQLEGILDRFVQAQAAAEAQARTTAGSASSAVGSLQTGVDAAASGQARARLGGGQKRVAQRPDAPQASAGSEAASSASQTTTIE